MARSGYMSEGTADFTSNTSFWGNTNRFQKLSVLTGSAVAPSIAFTSNASTGLYGVSSATIAFVGGIDFRTNSNVLSMATRANDSGRTIGELSLVFAASGISLMFSSGKTTYTIAGSAVSAAQA